MSNADTVDLLARVFAVAVTVCRKCGGRMHILDVVTDPGDIARICSAACIAPTKPDYCDPAPGDQPTTCLDIGLPDDRWVCALECSDAACPNGMRCEQVLAGDGGRSICF